ncbi:hypothetical protein [Tepidibacillus marianensis]|uniref:hypothetical protein n=1 Tax=Tepidibacillus marianensis TaxID=3131995 RepID=UPI0030D16164
MKWKRKLSGVALLSLLFYIVGSKEPDCEDFHFRGEHVITSLGKLSALFLAITMFFTFWKVVTGLYGDVPGKYEAMMG